MGVSILRRVVVLVSSISKKSMILAVTAILCILSSQAAVADNSSSPVISEIMLQNDSLFQAQDGSFPGWIELYNPGETGISLEGWYLMFSQRDGTAWRLPVFPDISIAPGEYKLVVFVDGQTTVSFSSVCIGTSLNRNITNVKLVNSISGASDSFTIPEIEESPVEEPQRYNTSFVRAPGFCYTARETRYPTPGMENSADIPQPRFVLASGLYDSPVLEFVDMPGMEDWEIRYTINDGLVFDDSDQVIGERIWKYPTNRDGILYDGPIPLIGTSVVKARYYSPEGACSMESVHTYIVGTRSNLPVVSIAMNPACLWDSECGMYTIGDDPGSPNFRGKWMRTAFVEIFPENPSVYETVSDEYLIRNYGSTSLDTPQKSFALYAKEPASEERIPNIFFLDGPADSIPDFRSIILRNSGGDISRTFLRDGLMSGLASDADIDTQDYQPAVVYINGQYWGILNIREKQNEYYIADHYGLEPDNIEMVKGTTLSEVIEYNPGSLPAFLELSDFISSHNAANKDDYRKISEYLDIDSFIDYIIFESFFNNTDWSSRNIKFWKYYGKDEESTWRWLMYDLDAGFDTTEYWTSREGKMQGRVDYNNFDYLFCSNLRSDIIGKLCHNLIRSNDFLFKFTERYHALLETVLSPGNLLTAVEERVSEIEAEIGRHFDRWSLVDPMTGSRRNRDEEDWLREIEILREFAVKRPGIVAGQLENFVDDITEQTGIKIRGGDFESDTEFWNMGRSEGKNIQEIREVDGSNCGVVEIIQTQEKSWESIAFLYYGIQLDEGESFSFDFDARLLEPSKSDEELYLIVYDPDQDNIVLSESTALTEEWSSFSYTGCNSGPFSGNMRLQFRVGEFREGQTLCLDNIQMETDGSSL